jgi:hypothetical protein
MWTGSSSQSNRTIYLSISFVRLITLGEQTPGRNTLLQTPRLLVRGLAHPPERLREHERGCGLSERVPGARPNGEAHLMSRSTPP